MTRRLAMIWAMVLANTSLFVWASCLEVETQFCGATLCPRGTVCSNVEPGTCVAPSQRDCGDGVVDGSEVCDDGGYQGPGDACSADCRSDLSCGNGIVDAEQDEACDCGANLDIAGGALVSRECDGRPNGAENGFCKSDCTLFCGDGVIAGEEICDGSNLGGYSCTDYGFDIGELQCSRCTISTRACWRIGWYLEPAVLNTPILRAIHGVERIDAQGQVVLHVFAVGDDGLIRHHDGDNWRSVASGTLDVDLLAVHAAAPDEVYVAGAEGVIAYYDGQRVVEEYRDPARERFVSIWAGGQDSLALTETGRLLQRTLGRPSGSSDGEVRVIWKEILKLPARMSAMWVREDRDLFFLSDSGNIYHYVDGKRADGDTLDDRAHYRALSGHGQTLVAVGDDGAVRRFDGTRWLPRDTVPVQSDLRAVSGRDPSNLLVVGEQGTCLHWNGVNWRQLNTRPLSRDADEWYQPQQFAGVFVAATGAVFAVDINAAATRRGVWRYNGAEWTFHEPMPAPSSLRAVLGAADGSLHALSQNGFHLYYNGAAWAQPRALAPDDASISLNALVGRASREMFAVGDKGAAFAYRPLADSWMQLDHVRELFPYGQAPDFLAAWAGPDGLLFIAGRQSTVVRCQDDGAACATPWHVDSEEVALTAIWGRSADEVYAASDYGILYKHESGRWKLAYVNERLPALTGLSGTDSAVFAVGHAGTVLTRLGDGSWTHTQLTGEHVELHAVFAVADDRAYAVGGQGALWHYNGTAWLPVQSFTDEPLTSVWGTGDTLVVGRADGVLATLTTSVK